MVAFLFWVVGSKGGGLDKGKRGKIGVNGLVDGDGKVNSVVGVDDRDTGVGEETAAKDDSDDDDDDDDGVGGHISISPSKRVQSSAVTGTASCNWAR